jgi:carbonic anhydrase
MRSRTPVLLLLVILLTMIPAGGMAPSCPVNGFNFLGLPVLDGRLAFAGAADLNSVVSSLPGAGGVIAGDAPVIATPAPSGSPDTLLDELLLGNERFRNDVYNSSIERYQELAAAQEPGVLWIGCSDSRSDPERITDAGPGEIFVTRNVGNIVPNHDWSLAAVVEYSINYLQVQEIVICGHSDCGAMNALDKNLTDPYIPLWLSDAREAKSRVDSRIPAPVTPEEKRERSRQIELENVRLQVQHLMTYPSVREAVGQGRVRVHGLYYDLSTGVLSPVV